MFDIDTLRVYPGHQMCHVKLDPLATAELDRKLRITLDSVAPTSEAADEIEDGTYVRVLGLQNDVTYRVWVIHKDEKWEDFPDNYKTAKPSERFIAPARTDAPARDVSSFFTVFFNILTSNYPSVITAPHGSFMHFGELETTAEQLTPINIERLRVLEATLFAGSLTDDEKTEYETLKGKITTGNAPVITYRVLARQHAATGAVPFSGPMELAPKRMEYIEASTEEFGVDLIWSYDNLIEVQIHARDLVDADRLCLLVEYLVDDYRDSFLRNGVPYVYFDSREADEFVQDGHVARHVRTVRIYARTQRVHRHAFPLIQDIETDIALATRSMDASVLIQDRDFA